MASSVGKLLKSSRIPLSRLTQGSTLSLISRIPLTTVLILPSWRDDGLIEIEQSENLKLETKVSEAEEEQMTSLGRAAPSISVNVDYADDGDKPFNAPVVSLLEHSDDDMAGASLKVTAHVPEKMNLTCGLEVGGDVFIEKKLEGDVRVFTEKGRIHVSKLRGHRIHLSTTGRDANDIIYSSDMLEGEKVLINTPGRVRAKRIHGSDVEVQVIRRASQFAGPLPMDDDDAGAVIDISSLYVSAPGVIKTFGGASLFVDADAGLNKQQAIRVKSNHGHVQAVAEVKKTYSEMSGPVVELGGVNGSCAVWVVPYVQDDLLAAKVHVDSLAQDSLSMLSSTSNVELTLDRKLETDLRLLSCPNIAEMEIEALAEDDGAVMNKVLSELDSKTAPIEKASPGPKINVNTDSFKPKETTRDDQRFRAIEFVEGHVENKSNEPGSRFEVRMGGGKIRQGGAAAQALHGFSSNEGAEGKSNDDTAEDSRPLVAVATQGTIHVESLSWLGAIARRYGLEEQEGRGELGRTATRRGRPLVPTE